MLLLVCAVICAFGFVFLVELGEALLGCFGCGLMWMEFCFC